MPTDATLTKIQRNAVFELIIKHKFDPTEFQWTEEVKSERGDSYIVSSLGHLHTQYYFTFGGYLVTWSPGRNTKVERLPHGGNWSIILSRLVSWLTDLREEVDAPDLWEIALQYKKLAELSTSPDENNNRPFSKNEQDYIVTHLQEIKRFMIATQDLNAEKQRAIETRIDYLIEAAERMGRKDWHMTLMGIIATLVIAAVVTPDRAQELFRMIADAFLPLFQSLLQLEG